MDSFRILLVDANPFPDYPVAPYGLEVIRAWLRRPGWVVEITNPFLESTPAPEALAQRVLAFEPHLVGLSLRNLDDGGVEPARAYPEPSVRTYLPAVKELVNRLRAFVAPSRIVLGGTAFAICPELILDELGLGVGIVGPGEESFYRLALWYAEQGGDARPESAPSCRQLPGLIYRVGNSFLRNRPRFRLPEEGTGVVERERAPHYFAEGRLREYAVRTRLGCGQKCLYCVEASKSVALRSPHRVRAELQHLVTAYHAQSVFFADSEFNLPDERMALEICRFLVESGLNRRLAWTAYFNIRPFSPSLAKTMQASNCYLVRFTVDSFNDSLLATLGKTYRCRDIEVSVETALAAGLKVYITLLLGVPGETEETLRRTLAFADGCAQRGVAVNVACGLRVYPNTGLAYYARRRGKAHLYGPRDPTFLQPVVYAEPSPPHVLYQRAFSYDFQSEVAGRGPGPPEPYAHPWSEGAPAVSSDRRARRRVEEGFHPEVPRGRHISGTSSRSGPG